MPICTIFFIIRSRVVEKKYLDSNDTENNDDNIGKDNLNDIIKIYDMIKILSEPQDDMTMLLDNVNNIKIIMMIITVIMIVLLYMMIA